MKEIIQFNSVKEHILTFRGQKVILDCDVAYLYDVQTKEVNQAVRNNPEKFPEGYIFELDYNEKNEVVKNFDHLEKLKFSRTLPKAFTEKGLYMLATILKSPKATQTTIAIVEAFAQLRELSRTIAAIAETQDEYAQKSLVQKGSDILTGILDNDMYISDTETTMEVNFALFKVKHTVKRKNK